MTFENAKEYNFWIRGIYNQYSDSFLKGLILLLQAIELEEAAGFEPDEALERIIKTAQTMLTEWKDKKVN